MGVFAWMLAVFGLTPPAIGGSIWGMNYNKYQPFPPVDLPDRTWPNATIDHAPIWCAVDLRDGNQSLIEPMNAEKKMRMFKHLVGMGFKEIEVGFPSASQVEYDFCRTLIEGGHIPDDVTIQVLVQSRQELIDRTFEAIAGAKNVIVHTYNSTSPLQRDVVFGLDKSAILDIAVQGAEWVRDWTAKMPDTMTVRHQYSPESFTQTELQFSLDVCHAVMDVYQPTPENKIILNLPATVESSTPNVHADQIEWFCRNLNNRESVIVSLHPHNDRGTAVAATELALMAGADRVEGTLFGNGERTGNVDLVTLGMNMVSQGVDAGIDFSHMPDTVAMAEHCNQLPVPHRHPYAGELVFTAFSGSHQDAIRKGMTAIRKQGDGTKWAVPYLPIDPTDVGMGYEAIVRVNSQSGKGGIAYILEEDYGISLSRAMQVDFSKIVQRLADEHCREQTPEMLMGAFTDTYLNIATPVQFITHESAECDDNTEMRNLTATVVHKGTEHSIKGQGNGPVAGYVDALKTLLGIDFSVQDYRNHARGAGSDATAIAYVEIALPDGRRVFGAGENPNIVSASLRAVTSAVNRI